MAKQSELEGILNAIGDKLEKAQAEIVAEIAALRDGMGSTDLPPEATAALERLETIAQKLDDIDPRT